MDNHLPLPSSANSLEAQRYRGQPSGTPTTAGGVQKGSAPRVAGNCKLVQLLLGLGGDPAKADRFSAKSMHGAGRGGGAGPGSPLLQLLSYTQQKDGTSSWVLCLQGATCIHSAQSVSSGQKLFLSLHYLPASFRLKHQQPLLRSSGDA